MSLIGK